MKKSKTRGPQLASILAAAMLLSLSEPQVEAKNPRKSVVGRINSKRFKGARRIINGSYAGTGFILSAGTRPGLKFRVFAIGCLVTTPPTTFPFSLACNGNYTETHGGGVKVWGTSDGLQVTFDALDAAGARGTVSGTLELGVQPAPAAVEDVRFAVVF